MSQIEDSESPDLHAAARAAVKKEHGNAARCAESADAKFMAIADSNHFVGERCHGFYRL